MNNLDTSFDISERSALKNVLVTKIGLNSLSILNNLIAKDISKKD